MQIAFMAFQGAEDDGIYYQHTQNYTPNNGYTYSEAFISDRVGVIGFGTSTRPALLQVGNTMLMTWKGVVNDGAIWMSKYIANPSVAAPFSGLSVTPAEAGWTNNLAIVGPGNDPMPHTSFGPSLANWNNTALMVWHAAGNDNSIWYGIFDANLSNQIAQFPTGINSEFTPAIINFAGTLIMVWRGEGSDDALYWATAQDPNVWHHHGAIPGAGSSFVPSLTVFNGQVFLAFKGVGSDTSVYMSQIANVGLLPSNTASWVYRWNVPGIGTSTGPSLCILNSQLFMSWKGDPGDTAIWYSSSPSGAQNSWAPQQTLGNGPPSDPQSLNYGSSIGPAVATFSA
ncbi:hypothetical protein [Tunturiibacter lichenicola]|jgi:hypothetical protein|uniref:hypothetical protein n=1 Tax=Tunturiibacter lichenicola TaxID=2051959 RepID=UPI003D9B2773